MNGLRSFFRIVDNASEWTGRITAYLIAFMLFTLLYEVVSRYLFHSPTLWAHEVSRHFYGAHFMLGGAYALLHGNHVLTDVLVGNLSTRKRAIVDAIFWLLFFFYMVLLLWKGTEMAWVSLQRMETTQTVFRSPVWPVKLTIPIGGALIFMQGIVQFIRYILTAITGEKLVSVVKEEVLE
jgi:TRAP-type mannitol/chloroaromatic compound transport system permease small subunit